MDCLLVIVLRGWDVLKENQVKKGRKSKHQSKGKKNPETNPETCFSQRFTQIWTSSEATG